MATFFSLYTLHFLLLTAGDFLLRTNAAPIDDICHQTREPPRCTGLLTSFDPRSKTAPLLILAQIAIDMASYNAGQTKIKVQNIMLSEKNPNVKAIYRNCENLYLDSLDALLIAPEYLKQRKYGKLAEAAGIVSHAVRVCEAALRNNVALKKENDNVGIVSEAIAAIAKNLHQKL